MVIIVKKSARRVFGQASQGVRRRARRFFLVYQAVHCPFVDEGQLFGVIFDNLNLFSTRSPTKRQFFLSARPLRGAAR